MFGEIVGIEQRVDETGAFARVLVGQEFGDFGGCGQSARQIER